ncbi:MAG: hypothetical protein LBV79_08390 [Candidatus Adiutrix sp.]|jgi:hypothetical protein|nr:hypothetical protein [Candidatus Adiutrix sp.]
MTHLFRAGGWRLVLAAVLSLGLVACARGPFSPEARMQSQSATEYMMELGSALATNQSFEWNTLSSALIVRALPYTAAVAQAADRRFAADPAYQKETAAWKRPAKRGQAPLVILMGLYTPDLAEKDITKLGRFRPRLKGADGQLWAPRDIKRYGRDAVFIRDHFPIFNPWEEVYLLTFDSPAGRYPAETLDFVLEWPGGAQGLVVQR